MFSPTVEPRISRGVTRATLGEPVSPFADLHARAALATAWPTLHLERPSETETLQALQDLQEIVGPCPQADLIEPWEVDDPYALRIALPGLEPELWQAVRRVLPDAELRIGDSPGALEAQDQRFLLPDVLDASPFPATLWSLAEGDGLRTPDLTEEDPDPVGGSLASELLAEVHALSPELVRHPGEAIAFVRHRPTGRRGLRLSIPAATVEALGGQALHQLRLDLIAAAGEVVARRATSEHALSPDLTWDPRFGFSLLVWRVGAPGPFLPPDSPLSGPLDPPPPELAAGVAALAGRVETLEIQVAPASDHDTTALAIASFARGLPLVGGPSRWLRTPAAQFCPTWRLAVSDLDLVAPWLTTLTEHHEVAKVRIVPAEPGGLEDRAPFLEPCWHRFGPRWVVRWRDAACDRDLMVAAISRDPAPQDRAVRRALIEALQRIPGLLTAENAPQPIIDSEGRHGLSLRLPSRMPEWGLSWVLGAITGAPLPAVSSLIDLALPATGPQLALWFDNMEAGSPPWGSTG